MRHRFAILLALVLAAVSGLVACGDDAGDSDQADSAAAATNPTQPDEAAFDAWYTATEEARLEIVRRPREARHRTDIAESRESPTLSGVDRV